MSTALPVACMRSLAAPPALDSLKALRGSLSGHLALRSVRDRRTDNGADTDARSKDGLTPLNMASEKKHREVVELLKSR